MEAVGIAASIIQVAGAGLPLAQVLYNYRDAVSFSRSRIRAIAFYIQQTAVVIQEVGEVFQDENHKHLVSQRAIETAAVIVENGRGYLSLYKRLWGEWGNREGAFSFRSRRCLNRIQTD